MPAPETAVRRPRRGVPIAVATGLALAAAWLGLASPASAQGQSDFVGIVSEDVLAGDADYRERTLSAQAAAGVGLIRQTFNWAGIEVERDEYDLSNYDDYVAAAADKGITILPVLFNPPRFRSGEPSSGARRGTYFPRNYGDMGDFGAVLVRRYGPDGTLWTERPEVRKLPIRAWQVWNEPNLPVYSPDGTSPRRYTALLAATAAVIRREDPSAEIVTAGLPESKLAREPLAKFVEGMYRAGAGKAFDTLAINTYASDHRGLVARLASIRRVMNRFGDRRAKLWATEFGWSDVGPRSEFRVGSRGQATRIQRSIQSLGSQRGRLGLRGFVYFAWRDGLPYAPAFKDFWGLHTGLYKRNGSPKPAAAAFRAAVGRLR